MFYKYLKTYLSDQQWDFNQTKFVFHELLIVIRQCMPHLDENLIEKLFRNYILVGIKFIYSMSRFINYLCISSWWCMWERERERKRERDESCSRPAELVISFFHHLEVLALKWFVATEQIQNAPFMLSRSVSEFTQKFWNSSWFRIEEQKMQVKKDFSFCERISVTKQLSKI